MKKMRLDWTTNADGDVTTNGERAVLGKLHAIEYRPGTTATGATVTVTCTEYGAVSKPLLTKASAGTSNLWFYPRDIPHGVEDGAVLTASAGGDRVMPLLTGVPRVVIASGGNALSGSIILFFE